jgi:predicted secreted hydrolase
MKKLIFLILILVIVAGVYVFLGNISDSPESEYVSVASAMSAVADENYSRALEPREFIFPQDHGAHNDYKLEWWYFTGNLHSADGQSFGYQFTIFRNALSPDSVEINSSYSANQLYFAHFGLTDISSGKHYNFEKFARGDSKLAGAESNPLNIYIENWTIKAVYPDGDFKRPEFSINANTDVLKLNLKLIPQKNMVLHGDRGLSPKSLVPGNASYYYSYTRLKTDGVVTIDGQNYNVSGNSWMDREWSTSALSKGQTGWDWFSIQFDDNTELMYFRLRDSAGKTDFAKGTYIMADGQYLALTDDEVFFKTNATNKLESGTVYPSKWQISIPKYEIDIQSQVRTKEQEMKLSVKYYEGSISITGTKGKKPLKGYGYVELTGYENKL